MIIRITSWFLAACSVSGIFVSWYLTQGFVVNESGWWQSLWDSYRIHGTIPADMKYAVFAGIVGMLVCLCGGQIIARRINNMTIFGDFNQKNIHGSAHWATMNDVKKTGFIDTTGVTVGTFNGKVLRDNGPAHVMVFAPTRSGKGVGLVLPTLLENADKSVVVLDIKGENYALTAGYRASLGHKVLKFEPSALEGSVAFNPFDEVRFDTPFEYQDCQNIALMIVDPDGKAADGGGSSKFFIDSAAEWLSAALLHILYRVRKEEGRIPSLVDANILLSGSKSAASGEEDPIQALFDEMVDYDHGKETVNQIVGTVAMAMKSRKEAELSGVLSTARTGLALFADPIISKNIAKSDFSIDELMNAETPVALYLVIPPSDIDRLRPLVRLLMNIMLRKLTASMEFEDGKAVQHYRHRLVLMLDEFTSIGKLEIFEKALAYMAGYGLKCFIIVQDLSQLHQAYGKEESVTSNCHVKLAYAPNRIETAKVLSDMAGKSTIIQKKRSKSGIGGKGGSSYSDSHHEVARSLLSPDEAMALPGIRTQGRKVIAGDILIFIAGHMPILGKQRLYFLDKTLQEKAKMSPPAAITSTVASSTDAHTNVHQPPRSSEAMIEAILAGENAHAG